MRRFILLIAAAGALAVAQPAMAASFGELAEWCAPEASGGRPGLCSGYLETYIAALASKDETANGGVRACVPEAADRAELQSLLQAYAKKHPESAGEPGVEEILIARAY